MERWSSVESRKQYGSAWWFKLCVEADCRLVGQLKVGRVQVRFYKYGERFTQGALVMGKVH